MMALVLTSCALSAPALARDAGTQADARADHIRLSARKLPDALDAIASAADETIVFDRAALSGIASHKVDATGIEAALKQAVAGTNLYIGRGNDGLWRVDLPAKGDIVVRAQRNEAELSYDVNKASSSSRDGKSLRDQPQATTVVTSKLMQDEQVQTVYQAMRNVGGATVNTGNVQGAATYTVRGFLVRPLNDGLADPAGIAPPVAGVERVEVLKGPAAILAGSDNLGGAVNVVMKKASADPILDVTAEYGSYDDYRFAVDGSTALDPDHKFSARLIAQTARADHNFAGYDGRFENFINPTLRFYDGQTDFNVSLRASDVRQAATPYASFDANGVLHDLSKHPVGPADQGFRLQNLTLEYDLKHDFSDWLTLVSRGHRSSTDTRIQVYAMAGDYVAIQLLMPTNQLQKTRTWADDTYLRAKFGTFGIAHILSAGVNYSHTRITNYKNNDFDSANSFTIISGLFDAPYDLGLPDFTEPRDWQYGTVAEQTGFYAQDFLEFGPVHVLGAIRHNKYTSVSDVIGYETETDKVSSTTPSVGAVVDVTKGISVYANYMRGFIPQFLFNAKGEMLPPQRSRNIEAGVKVTLPGQVSATLSAFKLKQTNTPVYVSYNVYDVTDGQESKGVELDLSASPLPGWDITGSYSYAEYDWLSPTTYQQVITGQPRHRYSVFTRYTLRDGPLANLGGSLGVFGYSKSYAGTTGDYSIKGSTKVDAHLYYKLGPVSANLGVENLFDAKIYGVATTETYIPVEAPRTFRLTLTYSLF